MREPYYAYGYIKKLLDEWHTLWYNRCTSEGAFFWSFLPTHRDPAGVASGPEKSGLTRDVKTHLLLSQTVAYRYDDTFQRMQSSRFGTLRASNKQLAEGEEGRKPVFR